VKYRKLRIAFSNTCLFACGLLLALWVRSYWWDDSISHPESGYLPNVYASTTGNLTLNWDASSGDPEWRFWSKAITKDDSGRLGEQSFFENRFRWRGGACAYVSFPHWSAILICATLAAVPELRWSKRFSLRTLLIAMTLVAMVLGLVVWAVR